MSLRTEKINSELKKALTNVINTRLYNEKLQDKMITITEVSIAPDLKNANVFVSIFPSQENDDAINALKICVPFMRKEIARMLNLRITPMLHFENDNTMEKANHIEELLMSVKGK